MAAFCWIAWSIALTATLISFKPAACSRAASTIARVDFLRTRDGIRHYEMSRYGTLRTWALELGLKDAAKLLQTTLDEEQATDIALTGIATSVVNQKAEG